MTASTTSSTETAITTDQLFNTLSNSTRRRILVSLLNHSRDGEAFDPEECKPAGEDRDRFELTLHHNHLPRLDEAGFVDWDREAGTVRRGPRLEEIAPVLRLIDDNQDELPLDWP